MRQDATTTNNSKWKRGNCYLLKSGLLWWRQGCQWEWVLSLKFSFYETFIYYTDGFFGGKELRFLRKHRSVTYQRAVLFTSFICVNSQGTYSRVRGPSTPQPLWRVMAVTFTPAYFHYVLLFVETMRCYQAHPTPSNACRTRVRKTQRSALITEGWVHVGQQHYGQKRKWGRGTPAVGSVVLAEAHSKSFQHV